MSVPVHYSAEAFWKQRMPTNSELAKKASFLAERVYKRAVKEGAGSFQALPVPPGVKRVRFKSPKRGVPIRAITQYLIYDRRFDSDGYALRVDLLGEK